MKSWLSYKIVHVFDVSQTEGKALPSIAKELEVRIDNFKLLKNSIINISPVPIEFNKIEGTSKGYYDPNNKLIKIKESMSEKQTIKTLIHELAHSKLHDNIINRNAAENEYINQGLSKNDIIFALSTIESDYDDLISIANSLLNKIKSIN